MIFLLTKSKGKFNLPKTVGISKFDGGIRPTLLSQNLVQSTQKRLHFFYTCTTCTKHAFLTECSFLRTRFSRNAHKAKARVVRSHRCTSLREAQRVHTRTVMSSPWRDPTSGPYRFVRCFLVHTTLTPAARRISSAQQISSRSDFAAPPARFHSRAAPSIRQNRAKLAPFGGVLHFYIL